MKVLKNGMNMNTADSRNPSVPQLLISQMVAITIGGSDNIKKFKRVTGD
jgi:hypothetical protein